MTLLALVPSTASAPLSPPVATDSATALAPQSAATSLQLQIDCELAYHVDAPSEFVFLVHAMNGMGQTVVEETLTFNPPTPYRMFSHPDLGNRFLRLHAAPGPLVLSYKATVDRTMDAVDAQAVEVPVFDLPDHTLQYLLPTRYCESDHLGAVSQKMFGALPQGYQRVKAVSDWVHDNVDYRIGSTNATTTAREVFVQRAGVCRDFAHLAVTLCRGLNIPARLVCGYAKFSEPPPDFHAVFEVWLGGRWMMFDPTGLAPLEHVVRVATGSDAKDVAFATLFGPARMTSMRPDVSVIGAEADATGPRG